MQKWATLLLFLCCTYQVKAQTLNIGLLQSVKLQKVEIASEGGSVSIKSTDGDVDVLATGEKATILITGGQCLLTTPRKTDVIATSFYFNPDSGFTVVGLSPATKAHSYLGKLKVTVEGQKALLTNQVSLKDYLAGVIESEGGSGQHLEYYKVQALLSRTYALRNKGRHKEEGFDLCDGVHCQAYHNRCKRSSDIIKAVEATRDEVIVDDNGSLVSTFFYANCGGETSDASYVWNTSVDYCRPFKDTFCVHTKQATWVHYVERSVWERFIEKTYGINITGMNLASVAYNFKQEQRKAFYIHPSLGIPLRDLRSEYKLKSTFFDVSLDGERVKLNGRGFGHGVGLCQEGAMQMAKLGYHYSQIALYYFDGVSLVRRSL